VGSLDLASLISSLSVFALVQGCSLLLHVASPSLARDTGNDREPIVEATPEQRFSRQFPGLVTVTQGGMPELTPTRLVRPAGQRRTGPLDGLGTDACLHRAQAHQFAQRMS
jgi:hypothetical protein